MLPWFTEMFMEANPSKFKFVVFSKTSHIYDIKISERVTLESVKCVKILGVQVDSLAFSEHTGLWKKAGMHINALSRSSKTFDFTKVGPYAGFVLSHFNFCPTVFL